MTGKNLEHRLQGDVFLGLFKCNRTLNIYKTYTRGRGPYREVMREYGKKKTYLWNQPTGSSSVWYTTNEWRMIPCSVLWTFNSVEECAVMKRRVSNGYGWQMEAKPDMKRSVTWRIVARVRLYPGHEHHSHITCTFKHNFQTYLLVPFPQT